MTDADAPTIDRKTLTSLEDLIGADKVAEFVRDYLVEAERGEAEMREAWSRGDAEAVYRPAHNLVSTAGNFGALRVSRAADEVQRAARRQDGEVLGDLIERLSGEIAEARSAFLELYDAA